MNIGRLTSIIIIAASVLAALSCKKDEEEAEVLPSLEGNLSFHAPQFIEPGQTLTMTPKGLVHPEDKGIGFYWKVTPAMTSSDTTRLENGLSPEGQESDGSFTYTFPDSLAVYTVACYAFADGYTGTSSSKYVTTVKPGLNGSLTSTGILPSDAHLTVDGQDYYYVRIGDLEWFRNNIGVRTGGAPYNNADIMSDVLGRYYKYEHAKQACESLSTAEQTWALPTLEDWRTLESYVNGTLTSNNDAGRSLAAALMADATFNSNTMWKYRPKVGDITNSSGFSAIPAGYANLASSAFEGVYEYAAFWADADNDDDEPTCRYIICDQPDMQIGKGDVNTLGASVRCVRESK